MRVASRDLAQECDALAGGLAFERDKLDGACGDSARAYRQAHERVLREYSSHELDRALRESCGAFVRAMKLKLMARSGALENEAAAAVGYEEPEKAIMNELAAWLKNAAQACHIRLNHEPVLYRTGLSAETLPHMDTTRASTPAARYKFHQEMRDREADLKARGLLSRCVARSVRMPPTCAPVAICQIRSSRPITSA